MRRSAYRSRIDRQLDKAFNNPHAKQSLCVDCENTDCSDFGKDYFTTKCWIKIPIEAKDND